MRNRNTDGFSVVEIVLVVAVIGLLGFGVWTLYQTEQSQQETATPQASQVAQPPEVNSADDLGKAEKYLEESDLEQDLDTSEFDDVLTSSS